MARYLCSKTLRSFLSFPLRFVDQDMIADGDPVVACSVALVAARRELSGRSLLYRDARVGNSLGSWWTRSAPCGMHCLEQRSGVRRGCCCRHSAQVRFGVGADVGEAGGIGHARGLASVGVGPALALLEFHGVIIEQLIDRDGRKYKRRLCSAAL